MNQIEIEAYGYYKKLYAPFIIFFRIGNLCSAFKEDASVVAGALNLPVENDSVSLEADGILNVVGELAGLGFQAKVIEMRGESGDFEVPDVQKLREEQELDENF